MNNCGCVRLAWTLLALAPLGCASAADLRSAVAQRAAYDLRCDAKSLEVTDLPGRSYGVRGCGQQASYVLTGQFCQNTKQLTKREVKIYCTPVLDHTSAESRRARPETDAAVPPTEPSPATEPTPTTDEVAPPLEATPTAEGAAPPGDGE